MKVYRVWYLDRQSTLCDITIYNFKGDTCEVTGEKLKSPFCSKI